MENKPDNAEQSAEPKTEPRKHSLGARLMVAYGISGIGAKLGTLGIPFDSNNLFEGKNLPLREKFSKEKFKAAVGEKLNLEILRDLAKNKDPNLGLKELSDLAGKNNPSIGAQVKAMLKASIKLTKYTTGLAVIGSVIGGVIGWKRGGLIEDWHDTVKHPIDSTKVILGFAKPEILDKYRTAKKGAGQKQTVETTESDRGNSKNWANRTKEQPQSKADGVLSAKSETAKSPALG